MIDDIGLNSVSEFGCATVTDRDLHLAEQLPFSDRVRLADLQCKKLQRSIFTALRLPKGRANPRTAKTAEEAGGCLQPTRPAAPSPSYLSWPSCQFLSRTGPAEDDGQSEPASRRGSSAQADVARPGHGAGVLLVDVLARMRARQGSACSGDRAERGPLSRKRDNCLQGPPCFRVAAALASEGTGGPPRPGIGQSSYCTFGWQPEQEDFGWFRCEDSEACYRAHRLRARRKKTLLVALAAFVAGDLIFGRRA